MSIILQIAAYKGDFKFRGQLQKIFDASKIVWNSVLY